MERASKKATLHLGDIWHSNALIQMSVVRTLNVYLKKGSNFHSYVGEEIDIDRYT